MKTGIALVIGWILFVGSTFVFALEEADLILFNGKVITVDDENNIFQAVAVKGDTILAVGSDPDIFTLAGPQSKMIDLNGKTVTPGLIDSHYHMMYYGQQFWPGYLNIRHPVVTSKADLLQVVGDYAQQLSPGDWISGNQGFALQSGETVDRWDIDSVAPLNPAYLRHSSGQFAVVNTPALEIAEIDSSTPNPPGSLIMHDDHGQPTGILSHYPAENLVGKHATGYGGRSDEEKFEDIERGQQLCLEAGYTSIQDVIVGSARDILLYREFAESGRLKVRLYTLLYIDDEEEADSLARIFRPDDSGLFRFAGWKLAMDGGIAARTILMYDKSLYASEISYPYHSQEEINRIVRILHDTGLQVAIHVGGDQGIDMVLTAFEEAMGASPRPDPRHRIEHGFFPTTAAVQRMKENNIILSTQPQWIAWYSDGISEATDSLTMERYLPLKTMLDMGIPLAFGCDVPASPYQEPKYAFHGATLRRSPQSGFEYNPSEKLTMGEALRVHTMGSAYAGFAESTTGSLEPGKYADLVIWSHDLYTMSPAELIDLVSEMTIVGGEIVYDAGLNPFTSVQSDEDQHNVPECFRLLQNHPNPFNPSTTIQFHIPLSTHVELSVYTILGERIRVLVNGRCDPGVNSVHWDGLDDAGKHTASGLYFCCLKGNGIVDTKKIVFLK
ncbi:MAG: amidohydrolase family protein [Gemmatimonadota bacterium]|nr:MAG: amidohydrolase family protein [Gemmatimonadota bacterium]